MRNPQDMTEEQIKAELYDIQYHNCNGLLSIPRGKNDKPCSFCARIFVLQDKLQELHQEKNDSPST